VYRIALWSILVAANLGGCSTDMSQQLAIEPGVKTRPLAVICDPPEAVPGEQVEVRLYLYAPDPGALATSWRVALDYRMDIYDELESEGAYVSLDETMEDLRWDAADDGTIIQGFSFVVPESTMFVSSGLPERVTDPLPPEMLELIDPAQEGYVTRAEILTFLRNVDPATLAPATLAAVRAYSDLFGCQIRLRGTITGDIDLDVTKNLTVRYSKKFGSDNVNTNPGIRWVGIIEVQGRDVDDRDEIASYDTDTTYVYHATEPSRVERTLKINPAYTYYALVDHEIERYRSPAGIEHEEDHEYHWHYRKFTPDANEDPLFVDDDGSEIEMEEMDEIIRFDPPNWSVATGFQFFLVVRDFRIEWRMFHATPGAAYVAVEGILEPTD